jgi:hypothetical protein
MEELQCNIVVMKSCQPKVLRLNLRSSDELQTPFFAAASSPEIDVEKLQGHKMKHSTPLSSPEEPSTSHTRTTLESTRWSFDTARSLFLVNRKNPLFERLHNGIHKSTGTRRDMNCPLSALELDRQRFTTLSKPPTSSVARNQKSVLWIPQNHSIDEKSPLPPSTNEIRSLASKSLLDQDMGTNRVRINQAIQGEHSINSSIRDAVSISRTSSTPPPLCSLCQHKAPVFGKPPRHFSYKELEEATDGFSDINFLAEGGFSTVHRGMLRDGQGVAVKRLKFGGSKSHADFCREVRILSCAQHKNVALLIGFCIEAKKRVLVYEYICNGSLDFQLHGTIYFLFYLLKKKSIFSFTYF